MVADHDHGADLVAEFATVLLLRQDRHRALAPERTEVRCAPAGPETYLERIVESVVQRLSFASAGPTWDGDAEMGPTMQSTK